MTLVQITHPDPQAPTAVYTLTLANPPDHRLTTALLADLLTALDEIERDWWARRDAWKADQARLDKSQRAKGMGSVGGAVIIRGEGEKFFSNGLSYEDSLKDPKFHPYVYNPVMLRLLTFPLITIAAINGHCFAGGFLLALACDFRLMREEQEGRRAWCCMNEVDFGAPFPPLFAAILRAKIPPPLLYSTIMGDRHTPSTLSSHGVVTLSPPSDKALLSLANELGQKKGVKASTGVWGELRGEVWRDLLVVGARENERLPRMHWQIEKEAKSRLGAVEKAKL